MDLEGIDLHAKEDGVISHSSDELDVSFRCRCFVFPICEQLIELDSVRKQLDAYRQAINRIDDYFEYGIESKKDQDFVHKTLKKLTEEIHNI